MNKYKVLLLCAVFLNMFQNINCAQPEQTLLNLGQQVQLIQSTFHQSTKRFVEMSIFMSKSTELDKLITDKIESLEGQIAGLVGSTAHRNTPATPTDESVLAELKARIETLEKDNIMPKLKLVIAKAQEKLAQVGNFGQKHKQIIITTAITVTVISTAVYLWKKYNNSKKQIIKRIDALKSAIHKLKTSLESTQDKKEKIKLSKLIKENLNKLVILNTQLNILKK